MLSTERLDIGAISAYAIAKEHGYTGTEEEFALLLANAGANAQAAAASAAEAAESAEAAADVAESIPLDYSVLSGEVVDLKSAVSAMNTATADDEGKALMVKTVSGGKVTEWEFGETGSSIYGLNPHNVLNWEASGVLVDRTYYDDSNDKTISGSNSITDYIPVTPGETVCFNYSNKLKWYGEGKVFSSSGNVTSQLNQLVTVPANVYFVKAQCPNTTKAQAYIYHYIGEIYDYSAYSSHVSSPYITDENIKDVVASSVNTGLSNNAIDFQDNAHDHIFNYRMIEGMKLFRWSIIDNSKNLIGWRLDDSTGALYYSSVPTTTGYVTTDFCPVTPGEQYIGMNGGVFGYNASKEFVSKITPSSYVFTVPDGVYYIRVSTLVTMASFQGYYCMKNGYGKTFEYNSAYPYANCFPMFDNDDEKNAFKLYLDLEPWRDKRIAVIGDSFSAPGTWQSQMCANFYAISDNHSISGGGWCNGRTKTVYQLAQEVTTRPDIVIICMGTNDVNDDNVTIGEFVNGTSVSDYSDATWIGGIQKALTYIRNQWTGVPVYVGFTPGGGLFNAGKWERQKTYIDAMRELCVLYSCVYIETRTCGKAYPLVQNDLVFNTSTSDGHPSSEGQAQIARYMTDLMSGYKAQRAWYNPS